MKIGCSGSANDLLPGMQALCQTCCHPKETFTTVQNERERTLSALRSCTDPQFGHPVAALRSTRSIISATVSPIRTPLPDNLDNRPMP